MVQENISLLARHAGTTSADLRARVRADKFITLRQVLHEAFAIPFIPDRPRKRSRDALNGPSKKVLADRLHNECADFLRSQSNAQFCIGASTFSDRSFANLFRKVNETAKCFENRHAKLTAEDVRAESSEQSQYAAADITAAAATPTHPPSDAKMADDESPNCLSTTSYILTADILPAAPAPSLSPQPLNLHLPRQPDSRSSSRKRRHYQLI